MKTAKIFLVILISEFFTIRISAQPGTYQIAVLQPVNHISYEPAGVLTVNEKNKLRFESADISVSRFLVNASQGTVKQEGEDFIVTPANTGDLVLSIYNYNDIENPVFIEKRKLQVVSVPEAYIAGKKGGEITKEEFAKVEKVECSGNYRITEFKLSIAGKEVGYKEFNRNGDTFSPEMIASIQQLGAGGKVFIEYIRATPEDGGATRQIPPLSFTIIE